MAYTHGAPSGAFIAPIVPAPALAYAAAPLVGIAPSLPTISPGDIQAAAIDAKVAAEDATQAAVDQARALTEEAVENGNEKTLDVNDQTKERSLEAFWSSEDQKWQALDALKTTEAKLDGEVASNAAALAKAALGTPVVATYPLVSAPIVLPFPGIVAPEFHQSIATQSLSQTHPVPIAKTFVSEPVKTADDKTLNDIKAEPTPADSAASEKPVKAAPEVEKEKATENAYLTQSLTQSQNGFIATPYAIADPFLIPQVNFIQPGLKQFSSSAISQIHGQYVVGPALVTTW